MNVKNTTLYGIAEAIKTPLGNGEMVAFTVLYCSFYNICL